ncbi:MAG: YdhR family protein [Boseongicola sp.]|nr:YdhR family protein [Boseongicola sp.]
MTKHSKKAVAAAAVAASMTASSAPAQNANSLDDLGYVVQFVRFESSLPREDVLAAANERRPMFEAMPGLVQKYYLELEEPNSYGGIYIWESKEAMAAFRETDIFKGIPAAYGIASLPQVDIIPVLFPLR